MVVYTAQDNSFAQEEEREEEEMVESTGVFQEGEEVVSCTTKPEMTINL